MNTFTQLLVAKFDERSRRNSSYSLRAFAASLGVDQSTLSKVLKGERQFSEGTRLKIMAQLLKDSDELHGFINKREQREGDYLPTAEEDFRQIFAPYHWVLLEMFKLPDFDPEAPAVAAGLGVDQASVRDALQRLLRVGYLGRGDAGEWKLLKPNTSWASAHDTTVERRRLQAEVLARSQRALEGVPFAEREHAMHVVAVSRARLPEFKRRLTEVREELGRFFQEEGDFDDVYILQLSLFPALAQQETPCESP